MKRTSVLLLALAALCSASLIQEFQDWKLQFNKAYATEELEAAAFATYTDNKKLISEMNANAVGAKYGPTKFADLTPDEFKRQYLMPKGTLPEHGNAQYAPEEKVLDVYPEVASLPSSFDWRDKNAVTPVKNQGQCGSCWAFSTTETIESAWFLAGNKLIGLSEQQIVDCDNSDDGCGGGNPPTAYEYVIHAGGMETESDYPYKAEDTPCTSKSSEFVADIKDWKYVTQTHNETQMMVSLYNEGPLSICVDAATWQFYSGGVIAYGDGCYYSLDHCVQLTGFSNQDNYKVWNVRNSWGTDWGIKGYLYVERGYDLCGIADEVTLPLVK